MARFIEFYRFPNSDESEIEKKILTQPRILAYFKSDYENISKAQNVKYFHLPQHYDYPLDLNAGFSKHTFRVSKGNSSSLGTMLSWLMTSENNNYLDMAPNRIKIYTKRFSLHKLLIKPLTFRYQNNYPRTILFSRFKGALYMSESRINPEVDDTKISFFHHQGLINHLFSDSSEPSDENVIHKCIYRTNLDRYDIIYSGAANGIIADKEFTEM
uniref:RAI1-like domain-containing protein n=1 Tax=Glossina brevipalpis TaxID=37001 RepID=A0A1A9W291_9MUSC